jgi:hypothetical protein
MPSHSAGASPLPHRHRDHGMLAISHVEVKRGNRKAALRTTQGNAVACVSVAASAIAWLSGLDKRCAAPIM